MSFNKLLLLLFFNLTFVYSLVIREVNVSGNYVFSKKEIISIANLDDKFNNVFYPLIIEEALNNLVKNGSFKKVNISLVTKNKDIDVNIEIHENPVIKKINFSGLKSFTKKQFITMMKTKEKRILNLNYLSEDIASINVAFSKNGFILSSIEHISISNNILQIEIQEPIIEEIIISGNKISKDYLLLREFTTKIGDIYNNDNLLQDRIRLLQLGYFSAVSLPKVLPGNKKDHIKIEVSVQEKELNNLNVGIGFTSYESFGFLKLSFLNPLRMGEQISLETQVGQQYGREMQNHSIRYYNPWFIYKRLGFGYTNYWHKSIEIIDNDLAFLNRSGFQLDFNIPLSNPKLRLQSIYRDEYIQDLENTQVDYFKKFISLSFTYDNRLYHQDSFAIAKGEYFRIYNENGGYLNILDNQVLALGGVSYLKQELDYKRFIKLFFDQNLLAFSLRTGLFNTIGNSGFFVDAEKYNIGGGNTVRGTPDYRPFATGLKKLIINLEYRIMLWKKVSLVTFFDIGNAFEKQVDINEFYRGYGFGLRYLTPIGSIRGDFAYSPDYESPVFHFGLGEVF